MISILLPTFNRHAVLEETLRSFPAIGFGVDWELIVVDNNSSDSTRYVCEAAMDRLPLRYVFHAEQGKNYAVRRALEESSGDLLLFTDDDVSPDPNWLHSYQAAADQWPDCPAFCGPVISEPPEGVDPAIAAAADEIGVGHFDPELLPGIVSTPVWPLGANFLLRRCAFDQFNLKVDVSVGPTGDSRVAGTETSLFLQLRDQQAELCFVSEARVIHRTDLEFWTLKTLQRRAFGQGRGRVRLMPGDGINKYWFDIPRFLFCNWVQVSAMEAWYAFVGNRSQCYRNRLRRHRVRGAMFEWRRMKRSGPQFNHSRT